MGADFLMKQTERNLTNFTVISRETGREMYLMARTREGALMSGAELLKEPMDALALYQCSDDW